MTKRHSKGANGLYHIKGRTYKQLRGSRVQVWNGTALKTDGTPGLQRKDLLMNKWGRIVSKKKHKTASKVRRLEEYGYYAKKGKFGSEFRGTKKTRKKVSRKGTRKKTRPKANKSKGKRR